jgi:hypothetical protein
MGIVSVATGGDHYRRNSALEQLISVVEAGAVHRRRPAGIFGGSKDNDGICMLRMISRPGLHNAYNCDRGKDGESETTGKEHQNAAAGNAGVGDRGR